MSQFGFRLALFALAVTMFFAFFGQLPVDPFGRYVDEFVLFITSSSVRQGLHWMAWFFPIGYLSTWIPAFFNALLAWFACRAVLFIFSIH